MRREGLGGITSSRNVDGGWQGAPSEDCGQHGEDDLAETNKEWTGSKREDGTRQLMSWIYLVEVDGVGVGGVRKNWLNSRSQKFGNVERSF